MQNDGVDRVEGIVSSVGHRDGKTRSVRNERPYL